MRKIPLFNSFRHFNGIFILSHSSCSAHLPHLISGQLDPGHKKSINTLTMYTQKAICKKLLKKSTSLKVQQFLLEKIIPVLLNKRVKTERIFSRKGIHC